MPSPKSIFKDSNSLADGASGIGIPGSEPTTEATDTYAVNVAVSSRHSKMYMSRRESRLVCGSRSATVILKADIVSSINSRISMRPTKSLGATAREVKDTEENIKRGSIIFPGIPQQQAK